MQHPIGKRKYKSVRKSTSQFKATEPLRPILPGQAESLAIRRSELRGDDVQSSNELQALVPHRGAARPGQDMHTDHTDTGALKTGQTLSRNPSRLAEKMEKPPIINSGMPGPGQPKSGEQNSPAHIPSHGWKGRKYAEGDELSKPYKQNSDNQSVSLAPSRKPKKQIS
jgi:hypothetical protein